MLLVSVVQEKRVDTPSYYCPEETTKNRNTSIQHPYLDLLSPLPFPIPHLVPGRLDYVRIRIQNHENQIQHNILPGTRVRYECHSYIARVSAQTGIKGGNSLDSGDERKLVKCKDQADQR